MKLLSISCLICIVYLIQPVENHFLNWVWNKVQQVIKPSVAYRHFDCGKSDIPQILPQKFDFSRVTGGLSAAPHSFPWIVNVLNIKSLKSCGGAIINSNTILTAAHCIIDQPKYIKVVAGAANLFGRLNLFNYHSVSQVIVDPNYISCCDHDLAIIKLEKNLERSQMINSICLPQEDNLQLKPETMAFVAGWGGKYPHSELNAFGSFNLKQGLVYIKENQYCQQTYGSFDGNDEICATNLRDRVDTREGDSGGPLMVLNQTDHRWYLFGITSHGASTEAIKPGVYSSVSTKLDFIRKYL